ncbi:iron chelate uptake ABC transporter family permease subunit [Candidatus Protochlamydia naegleriophila]|nr:iron chelate uptake ABC transporter family permease subunit [Candidatus Protochlamydia naegleriophila]
MIDAQTLFSFFTDPILRAPTIGCMLMCLAASLVGVVVFLRKQVLAGETLSHASYPGVIVGILLAGFFFVQETDELKLALFTLGGAFTTSLLGLWIVHVLERRMKLPSDAALCFVLSTFFGVGLMLTSEVQFSYTSLYKQVLTYLYGQAATMTDIHIAIYGVLSFLVLVIVAWLYKEIQVLTFDRQYARSLGIRVKAIDALLFILLTLAVIIGIRSVGVVLMSAMLIAPAVAARQFTNRLSVMFVLAGLFGMLSGFFGNFLSVQLTDYLAKHYAAARIVLPTGPMIVIVASGICLMALLLAPERGLLVRLMRIAYFRYECICENLLKAIWRLSPDAKVGLDQLAKYQASSRLYLQFILWRMKSNGWIHHLPDDSYQLTQDGQYRAAKIVRLHRLWEVYLVNYLGAHAERVHHNAEEMEHILTPELEKELTLLLKDPKQDPHHQPIPPKEETHAL